MPAAFPVPTSLHLPVTAEGPISLTEQTVARLRDLIVGGEILPGEHLSETQLAQTLDVSRNTLREAFRLLTREGLLTHEQNRGVFVSRPSLSSILDIYRVRRLLEVPLLAQAWPGHSGITQMRQAVTQAEAAAQQGDWRKVGSENIVYHSALVSLSDSPRLMGFFYQILIEMRLTFGLLKNPEMLHAPFISMNRAITDLAADGKMQEASEMLDNYLTRSERTIMTAFANQI